ncbi:hypothetical protein G4B88_015468 [Cannabis sativa]|uniref:Cytochrome P450 n=1 Tax=Cannabis sativa TaxID=3483 RepID=A0A7J6DL64_CANSA|nr:hypothetical protein G4B88_015468 [Cannabis sativa]
MGSHHSTTSFLISVIFSIALLVIILLLFIIKFKLLFNNNNKQMLPPGPTPWPILGNIPEFLQNRPSYRWLHHLMKELNTDIACIRLGKATHLITVTSPKIAREFLKKHDAVFASRPHTMVTTLLSNNYKAIVVSPYDKQWKKMRRVVCDVLSHSKLTWLLEKRTQEADNLVRFVYNQANQIGGGVVNVRVAAQQYSVGVLRRMILGRRYFGRGREDGGPGKEEEEHVEALLSILSHAYAYSVSDILPWLRWFDLDGHQTSVRKAMEVVNKYQGSLVKERIQEWRDSNNNKKAEDLLDILISLKDSDGNPLLSEDEIQAQITELFIAVVDNPYSIVEWALSEMLNQPEMLEKATQEIDRVVMSSSNGTSTVVQLLQECHIPQLPYLVACAREALRLHPVSAFNLPHLSMADCTVAGYFIPKGSHILLSRLGLGRNPTVWDDQPLVFNPDRHLPENRRDLVETDLRFVSFTTGRRGCIGAELGTNITIMLLGRLLQCFNWKIPQGMDNIDLSTEKDHNSLFKAKPFVIFAIAPLLIIILLLTIFFIKFKQLIPNNNHKQSLPPGPTPWPIFGSIPELLFNRPTYRWLHDLMNDFNTDIACIRLGTTTHLITVTSPEIARELLKKHDAIFASRPLTLATSLLSQGYKATVVSPCDDQWRKMKRALVSNVINHSKLAWLLDKRTQEADNLVRFVYNQANQIGGGVVNVRVAAQQYSVGVLRRMIFGRRYFGKGREDGGPGKEEEEHVEALFSVLSHSYSYSVSDILTWLRWFDLDGHQRSVRKAMEVINKYQGSLVKERIREWRDNKKVEDLLDVLISLKDSDGNPLLCEDEIQAQLTELFIAVVNNPHTIAESALSEMLKHPEMLEKATQEIDRVIGNEAELLQESHVPQLTYLIACAREALRLHPVSTFNLPHLSIADCTVAGYFIPKGSHILISRSVAALLPGINLCDSTLTVIFPRTDVTWWRPIYGRRGCIGMELGTNMTIMLLGRLLQCFAWKIPKGVKKMDLRIEEEENTLLIATPLFAHATPRFNPSFYAF